MKQSKKIALGLSALALFLIAISFLHDPLSGSGTVTRKVLL